MKLSENIHFRCTTFEKNKIDKVLNDMQQTQHKNISYRTLFINLIDNYLTNNIKGLEIKKEQILKEIDKEKEKQNQAVNNISNLEIELKNIEHELNNKSLFDETNFKNHEQLNKALTSVKEYIFNNNINNVSSISDNYYLQINETFKIKNVQLLKNIVETNFNKWQLENERKPQTTKNKKVSKETRIKQATNNILIKFNKSRQYFKLSDFIENEQAFINARCKQHKIKYNDLIKHLETLPEHKKQK